MIVDSMTLKEIHEELHKDFTNTIGTLDNRLRKFGSVVLKTSRYPVRRHYECKSIEKRNRFWVMLTAIKRGEWNDPVIDYYCVFDRPEGLFCAFLDPKGGNSFVFPPHFFSRYRERVLGGSDMSGPDLIKFFVNRIWRWSFMLLSDDRKKGVASMDEVLSKEKLDFMAYHPDGIMFGERTDNIYLIKTIVTFDMLYRDQEEMMSDLFDVYYNSLANSYPDKIVEYVLALENDYDRRPRDI